MQEKLQIDAKLELLNLIQNIEDEKSLKFLLGVTKKMLNINGKAPD